MLKRAATASALLLIALVVSNAAHAVTKTGTMSLKVVVVASPCAVSGATLDFGTYTAGQGAALDASAVINFTACGPGTVKLEIDGGQSGAESARKLSNAGVLLGYALYQDSARTKALGTGANAASLAMAAQGTGKFTVYGRIPAKQNVAVGTYTDTVNITLSF